MKVRVERTPIYGENMRNAALKETVKTLEFTEYDRVVLLNGKSMRVDGTEAFQDFLKTGTWQTDVYFGSEKLRYRLVGKEIK